MTIRENAEEKRHVERYLKKYKTERRTRYTWQWQSGNGWVKKKKEYNHNLTNLPKEWLTQGELEKVIPNHINRYSRYLNIYINLSSSNKYLKYINDYKKVINDYKKKITYLEKFKKIIEENKVNKKKIEELFSFKEENELLIKKNTATNNYNVEKKKLDDYKTRIARHILPDFDEKNLGINKFYIKAVQTNKYLCVDNNTITLRDKPYIWELVDKNNTPLTKDIFLSGKNVIIRDPRTETYLQWNGKKKNLVVIKNNSNIFWNLKLDALLFTKKENKSIEKSIDGIKINDQGPYHYRFDFLSPQEARKSYFVQPMNDKAKKIYIFDGKKYLHKTENNSVTLKEQPFDWELILFTETTNNDKTVTSERSITIGELISMTLDKYSTEIEKKYIKLKVPGEDKYLSLNSSTEKLGISEKNDNNFKINWIFNTNFGLVTKLDEKFVSLNDIKIDGKKHYFLFEHYNPPAPIISRIVKETSSLNKLKMNNIPNNFNEKDWITIKKNKENSNNIVNNIFNNANNANNRKCKAVSVAVDEDETQYVWVITEKGDVLHAKLNKDTKVEDIKFKNVGNTKLEYIKVVIDKNKTQHLIGTNKNISYYLEVKQEEEILYKTPENNNISITTSTNISDYNKNITDFKELNVNLKQVSIDINNNNAKQILGITPDEQEINTKYYGNISRTTQVTVNKILQKSNFNIESKFNEIILEEGINKLFVHLSVSIGKDNTPVYYAILEGGIICNFDKQSKKWVSVMQLPDHKKFFSVEVKIDNNNNQYLYAVDSKANFYFIKDIFEESNNFQKIEYSPTSQFTGAKAFDIGLNKNNTNFHHLWIIDANNNLKYKKIDTSIPVTTTTASA